jgi:hypothetical protein
MATLRATNIKAAQIVWMGSFFLSKKIKIPIFCRDLGFDKFHSVQ